jgi:hypothetical protein
MAKAEPLWRIDVVGGMNAKYLGIVTAPNASAAIEKACEEFGIDGVKRRKRLVAQPIAKPAHK